MGVKNNFSQAMSELIGISRNVEPEHKKELNEEQTEELLETDAIALDETEEDGALQEMSETEKDAEQVDEQKEGTNQAAQNPKDRIMAMLAAQQAQQPQSSQPQMQQTQQASQQIQPKPQQPKFDGGVTTIARGTVIIGEINADGDVELLGSVKGKIASQGDIKANGKVIGDLIGKDIELISCAVQGNILASGLVTVDGDSVVVGDVKGENFCLDGKIKGNVTVEKEAKFQPKAILAGNVTTASIAMSQGAKIQGEVNIPLSEKETDMSFDIDMII
jgi:cytoskeletal protein CcmA (bactofilin family)